MKNDKLNHRRCSFNCSKKVFEGKIHMVSAGNENLKSECNACLKIMELISNEINKSKIGSVAY